MFLSRAVKYLSYRVGGTERPQKTKKSRQSGQSVMVLSVLCEKRIIGTYFYENENLRGKSYNGMLGLFFFFELIDYPSDMIFKEDVAPPQYANLVRRYFDLKVPNC